MKRRLLAAGCAMLLLSGCNAARQQPSPVPPVTQPQAYTEPEDAAANPGSLYSESDSEFLFSDNRARRVGDIVLVKVVETDKAKNKADTTADKTSTNELGVSAFFGQSSASINPLNPTGPFSGPVGANPVLGTSSTSKHSATGETKRESTVTTTIAARVLRVLPGGLMEVEGARETRVNDETQYIVVSGLVRARDVASDNSVTSSQMANARIEYYGKGTLADKQKPGWFTRLMDNVWPF